MRPITRLFFYSIALFLLIVIALKPYNWFCQTSGKCQKIYVSDLFPTFEGDNEINLILEAKSHNPDLDFMIMGYDTISTVSGRKNVVKYKIKNLSNKRMVFRPKFHVEPKQFEKYVNRSDCLCFEDYALDANDEINLQAAFSIDSDIDKDHFKDSDTVDILISYSLN